MYSLLVILLCSFLGVFLGFFWNVDEEIIVLMSVALIGAILTYYSAEMTNLNRVKESKDKVFVSFSESGWKLLSEAKEILDNVTSFNSKKRESNNSLNFFENELDGIGNSFIRKAIVNSNRVGYLKNRIKEANDSLGGSRDYFLSKRLNIFFLQKEILGKNEMLKEFYGLEDKRTSRVKAEINELIDNLGLICDYGMNASLVKSDIPKISETSDKIDDFIVVIQLVEFDNIQGATGFDSKAIRDKKKLIIGAISVFALCVNFLIARSYVGEAHFREMPAEAVSIERPQIDNTND